MLWTASTSKKRSDLDPFSVELAWGERAKDQEETELVGAQAFLKLPGGWGVKSFPRDRVPNSEGR